ncbi:MAG: ModD protein [Campylobacter sp.]|nr:ModD protein [Campylobacter sp.]
MFISEAEILNYINEDLPYFDLTTSLQDIDKNAVLSIFSRDEICVSGADIVAKIAKILNCKAEILIKDRNFAKANDTIVKIYGAYNDVHKAWKLCQILLEYTCQIATYTHKMQSLAKSVNQKCEILSTRKSFPFAKKICLNAVLHGGGGVHRLNLSDSVLFFKNHIKAYENYDEFLAQIPTFKAKAPERKIGVECENLDEFKKLLKADVDMIQCDKFSLELLSEAVNLRDRINSRCKIIASGGINAKNAKEYAATGIDAITTSAPYTQGLADISAKIEIL